MYYIILYIYLIKCGIKKNHCKIHFNFIFIQFLKFLPECFETQNLNLSSDVCFFFLNNKICRFRRNRVICRENQTQVIYSASTVILMMSTELKASDSYLSLKHTFEEKPLETSEFLCDLTTDERVFD